MRKHPVRKFLGLTVLYAVIIVGIFVLQFKTESVISKNIGSFHLSLAQTESETENIRLKNLFTATFKGLTLSSSEEKSASISRSDGSEKKALVLESCDEKDNENLVLNFTDGSSITFTVVQSEGKDQLSIMAKPASGYSRISIPFKTSGSWTIKEQTSRRMLISSKDQNFSLIAPQIDENEISFFRNDSIASYSFYDPSKLFDYSTVIGTQGTDARTYENTIRLFRENLVEKFTSTLATADSSSLSESEVIAYVAEMARSGKYGAALDAVPESFKKGNKRTYLSSPYFDNLAVMNRSLVIQSDRYKSMVDSSLVSRDLNIFTISGIEDYILREKRTAKIRSLLAFPSGMDTFEPNLAQASGIINVYAKLAVKDAELSKPLEKVLEKCLEAVASQCKYENQNLSLKDKENSANVSRTVETASALISLGEVKSRQDLIQSGRLLVNFALANMTEIDLHTLSELYPLLVKDNSFYPHTEILGYYGNTPVWAWTCASSITYTIDQDSVVNLNIDFPLGLTHYIIFNGIPTFHSNIEIQKQKFRTDPRFETYNSSGYVYQSNTETLFIKSRHKSQIELIRLFCDPPAGFVKADIPSQPVSLEKTQLPLKTSERPSRTVKNSENPVSEEKTAPEIKKTTETRKTSSSETEKRAPAPAKSNSVSESPSQTVKNQSDSSQKKETASAPQEEKESNTTEEPKSESVETSPLQVSASPEKDNQAPQQEIKQEEKAEEKTEINPVTEKTDSEKEETKTSEKKESGQETKKSRGRKKR